MSYDISLTAGAPGYQRCIVDVNYTSNCGPIWRAAGCDLAEYDGKTARELIPSLENAITDVRKNRRAYEHLEPKEWGSIHGMLEFLDEILDACRAFPDGVIGVIR